MEREEYLNFADTYSNKLLEEIRERREQIKFYKMAQLVEEGRGQLPEHLIYLLYNASRKQNRESLEVLLDWMKTNRYEMEFQERFVEHTPLRFKPGGEFFLDLTEEHYELVLKRTIFRI